MVAADEQPTTEVDRAAVLQWGSGGRLCSGDGGREPGEAGAADDHLGAGRQ